MIDNDANQPERPRVEPEIIAPDRFRRAPDWRQRAGRPYVSALADPPPRIYVGRFGPFGFVVFMVIIGILAAAGLLATLGAVLVWIPLVALLVGVGALVRFLRR
jgi:hypothetical protein